MTAPVGVVGGGIVGIAIARALSLRDAGPVVVFEKDDRLGSHQTGHNSGVVHAGIYYRDGSLKSDLCGRGRELLREYCADRELGYVERGKLVIATDDSELAALSAIEQRAHRAGVPDIARVESLPGIRAIEPHAHGIAAIHFPKTAVTDYRAVTEALATDVLSFAGNEIRLDSAVRGIRQDGPSRVLVTTALGDFAVSSLIISAGLFSDRVGRLTGGGDDPAILPLRGESWTMGPDRDFLVSGLIYPVPDPRYPFLGVHFTRGTHGDVHVGPNGVPELAREGYRWTQFSVPDLWSAARWRGARAFARQHWRMGLSEIAGSLVKPIYLRRARRYLPDLRSRDLAAQDGAGVQAQAITRTGALVDDFAIEHRGPITIVRNATSPAATASLAIAEHVVDRHFHRARKT